MRPGYNASEVEVQFTVHGFEKIGTGGNYTAFQRPLSADGSRYALVTQPSEPLAPETNSEDMRVGLYGPDHSEELDSFTARCAQEAAEGIRARGWE